MNNTHLLVVEWAHRKCVYFLISITNYNIYIVWKRNHTGLLIIGNVRGVWGSRIATFAGKHLPCALVRAAIEYLTISLVNTWLPTTARQMSVYGANDCACSLVLFFFDFAIVGFCVLPSMRYSCNILYLLNILIHNHWKIGCQSNLFIHLWWMALPNGQVWKRTPSIGFYTNSHNYTIQFDVDWPCMLFTMNH